MALINWSDDLSVGVASIDVQHKRLVDMMNQLHEARKAGKGNDVLGGILGGLVEYTAMHFKTEEGLFAQHGYPDTAAHKQEHAALVKEVVAYQAKFKAGEVQLNAEIMNFLKKWLTTHILGSDMKYGPFLSGKGVS